MSDYEMGVIEAMEQYGGSFVVALAKCFRAADHVNFAKLRTTFVQYWEQYSDMAAKR